MTSNSWRFGPFKYARVGAISYFKLGRWYVYRRIGRKFRLSWSAQ